jgi:hypothetical protein
MDCCHCRRIKSRQKFLEFSSLADSDAGNGQRDHDFRGELMSRSSKIGTCVNPSTSSHSLSRYEVHLDRKLERMLTVLLRLKELRCAAVEG